MMSDGPREHCLARHWYCTALSRSSHVGAWESKFVRHSASCLSMHKRMANHVGVALFTSAAVCSAAMPHVSALWPAVADHFVATSYASAHAFGGAC
ncbi:hypothetical protein BD309DRAFT_952588 [Dichomitus squalens]|uniref:Uncharacterized protein n=1 Tax=Dichomitus squalens TaxID=114155 RepID=A0A4Q9Q0U8_9APHY|nr:hypothetical protein BD309DRAFT_952588 [Dichomitus squalens]TBU60773.1 hypothetical protein BD310DRAFT_922031 [Dichomitus squalens]